MQWFHKRHTCIFSILNSQVLFIDKTLHMKIDLIGKQHAADIRFTRVHHLEYLIFEIFSSSQICICDRLRTLNFIQELLQSLSHNFIRSRIWQSASSNLSDGFPRTTYNCTACKFWGVILTAQWLYIDKCKGQWLLCSRNACNRKPG